jgi:cytochrome c oxidase subunit IV
MDGTGSAEREGGRAGGPTAGTCVAVWLCLLAGTALTVTTARLVTGRMAIAVVLVIAAAKGVLVLLYFMRLRWERRLLVRLVVPITLVVLAVFIALTYTDVLTR